MVTFEYLEELNKLLGKYKISFNLFVKFCELEKFTTEEVNELGYMEDKMEIWQEMIYDTGEE